FAARTWGPQPLRIVLSNFSNSCSYTFGSAADVGIQSVADLKGKRVTWVQGSPSLNNATAALLAYSNLAWEDVERVDVGRYNTDIDSVINGRTDLARGSSNSQPFLRLEAAPRGLRFISFPHRVAAAVKRVRDLLPW